MKLLACREITVPVLIVNGSADRMCTPSVCASSDTLRAAEEPWFGPPAHLQTYVLPGSGHAINLAPNTTDYQATVTAWIADTVRSG